jgi:PleD family two-component response regulator
LSQLTKKKYILVVDDSEIDRQLMCTILKKNENYIVLEASNASECLKILSVNKIDLILMDIIMPGMHGSELLGKIREQYNEIELPIIMISAKNEVSEIVECLKNGASDYITKPINFQIASMRIKTQLKIANLSIEMTRIKKKESFDELIADYNHEINNPLNIALGYLQGPKWQEDSSREKINNALWRIVDIVKKIQDVTAK